MAAPIFLNVLLRETPSYTQKEIQEEATGKEQTCQFVSILDYLTFGGKVKIRVFLASKPLLLALFERESLVDQILKERMDLARAVRRKKEAVLSLKDASERFEKLFASESPFRYLLDFNVSTTTPPKE